MSFATDVADMIAQNCLALGEDIVAVLPAGTTRAIKAVVERQAVAPLPEETRLSRPPIRVTVANIAAASSSTSPGGIGQTEFDAGTWKLRFSRRPGVAAEDFRIARVADSCAGGMVLEI
jgi:hypothetical protein